MPAERLNREQFYDRLAALDEAGLRKVLWTLYWRGSASVRERMMAVVDPSSAAEAEVTGAGTRVDADALLAEVREFAALARQGSYLAGDRRVSPKERTRWRFTFQRLAKAANQALAGRDVEPAASAMATLIDLARELKSVDYFHVVGDPARAWPRRLLRARGRPAAALGVALGLDPPRRRVGQPAGDDSRTGRGRYAHRA